MRSSRGRSISGVAATLILAACNDPVTPGPPDRLEILQAAPVAAAPGLTLFDTISVRLIDNGRSRKGQRIIWTVRQGGGMVVPLDSTTNVAGVAQARWTLGQSGLNELEARTLDDSAVVFRVNAEAFRADRLDSDYGLGCGLAQGNIWCWGQYSWVQGRQVSEPPPDPFDQLFSAPGRVSTGQGFIDLAVESALGGTVCGLQANGTVQCFGYPGDDPILSRPSAPPLRTIVASEFSTFCGLALSDSTAWCWDTQTGIGQPVPGSLRFLDIRIGLSACGLLVDSTAVCWGLGTVGKGILDPSDSSALVGGALHFAELAVGWTFACGLTAIGELWCWGENGSGELGGYGPASLDPILVATNVTRLATYFRTGIAIQNGTVVRWGELQWATEGRVTPIADLSGVPVVDFATNDIACVHLVDHQVLCFDELWFNSTSFNVDRYTPVQPIVEP